MKKLIIMSIAVLALVACLAVARWAGRNTGISASTPAESSSSGTVSTVPQPSSTTTAPVPGDIENGLGWG